MTMSEQDTITVGDIEPDAAIASVSDVVREATVGATFRAAREARGLRVEDAAASMKLRPRQIEAIEADQFEVLGGATYVRGFVRGYAKLLGLDAEALTSRMAHVLAAPAPRLDVPASEGVSMPTSQARRKWMLPVAALLVPVLVAGGLFAYFDYFKGGTHSGLLSQEAEVTSAAKPATESAPPQSVSTPVVVEAAPFPPDGNAPGVVDPKLQLGAQEPALGATLPGAVSTPAYASNVAESGRSRILKLTFSDDAWVEVKDAEGRIIYSQLNHAGNTQVVEGRAPLAVVIGNSANVKLLVDEQPIDLRAHTKISVARLTLE